MDVRELEDVSYVMFEYERWRVLRDKCRGYFGSKGILFDSKRLNE